MPAKHNVLIASRSREAAEALRNVIAEMRDLSVDVLVMDAAESDPMSSLAHAPDLLLLRIDGDSTAELEALAKYTPDERPALIVIGNASNAECMRIAMRAGARDFLAEPALGDDLIMAVTRVKTERHASKTAQRCQLTAFINAKGGAGATFLACNVAHLFTMVSRVRTALLDLDLQFGTLPQYLDIQPQRGLLEALEVAHDLDGVAINAYLTKHTNGLSVLCGLKDSAMLQQELMTDRFEAVLALLTGNFERLIADLPRQIDPFTALTLERADQVVLVLQQSIPSLHDATRMYELLTRSLAIPSDHIDIVVNRYDKSASVELSDIQQALDGKTPLRVANDYRAVMESINMGLPMYEQARRSAVTKSLMGLETHLGGSSMSGSKSLFSKRLRRVV